MNFEKSGIENVDTLFKVEADVQILADELGYEAVIINRDNHFLTFELADTQQLDLKEKLLQATDAKEKQAQTFVEQLKLHLQTNYPDDNWFDGILTTVSQKGIISLSISYEALSIY
jgi:hypothetical protein